MSKKLFIGNVPTTMTSDDLVQMFAPYGEIVECDIIKNYAFLHYRDPESANRAAVALNSEKFEGRPLRVEVSHSKVHTLPGSADRPRGKTSKLFVGNVSGTSNPEDLKKLFDTYGKVVECDIVRDFAFVHYEHEQEADLAADMLNGAEFSGAFITVERSHSRPKKTVGEACYNCGRPGHFSRDCRSGMVSTRGGPVRATRGTAVTAYGPPPIRAPPIYDPYDEFEEYYAYRARYGPPPREPYRDPREAREPRDPRDRLPPLPERYRDYVDPYDRNPPRYPRDPYERPPPYYYDTPERRPSRDPYEERYRYTMRSRDELPRRRAPPPY